MFLLPSLQSRASSEFSSSLAWRTKLQASRLPRRKENRRFTRSSRRGKRRLGTSCSMIVSTQPRAHTLLQGYHTKHTEWFLELGKTFSHRERGGDWRSDTQYGFSLDTMWEGVLERSSCRHWYSVPSGQDRDGTTQFHTFSESILEQGNKELRIRRVSWRSTNDQDSAKMPEMWIKNTISGRRSTVMELASATPLNESKFLVNRPQSP